MDFVSYLHVLVWRWHAWVCK